MYRSLYPINLSDSCEDISVDTSGKKLLIKDKNDVLLNISFEELQTSLLQNQDLQKIPQKRDSYSKKIYSQITKLILYTYLSDE